MKALTYAALPYDFESIVAATAGFIFLGTPFYGSWLVRVEKIITAVTAAFKRNHPNDINQLQLQWYKPCCFNLTLFFGNVESMRRCGGQHV